MAFGLSFGSNKQKVDQTQTTSGTQTQNQTQTGTNTTSGTTSTNSSTTGSQSSTGTQSNATSGTSSTTGTTTGTSTQTTSQFDQGTLSGLTGAVQDLLGSVMGNRGTVDTSALSGFNPGDFVSGGMANAKAIAQASLDDNINQLISGVGGTPGTNSATALLANKLRNDTSASLAGTEANLNAQAQEIVRQNIATGQSVQNSQNDFLSNLLGALRGGNVTTTGTEAQTTAQNTQNQQISDTRNAENTNTSSNTNSTQVQNLIETLNQILSGTTTTNEVTNLKGTTSKSGGGLSLSL